MFSKMPVLLRLFLNSLKGTNRYDFGNYKIHIGDSNNYPGKFVAYVEEFHNVISIINDRSEAKQALMPLFEKEIFRLNSIGQKVPKPGSGKAKITFAANSQVNKMRPFADDFWDTIFNHSYSLSFVSDDSRLDDWLMYVNNDKDELLRRVYNVYSVDISSVYHRPVYEILAYIKDKSGD